MRTDLSTDEGLNKFKQDIIDTVKKHGFQDVEIVVDFRGRGSFPTVGIEDTGSWAGTASENIVLTVKADYSAFKETS